MPFTTDDLAAWRAKKSPSDEFSQPDAAQSEAVGAIRFTLRELLIAVTVVGVLMGILRAAGIFGAVFAFLATVVFTWGVYPALRRDDLRAQRAMFDFLWGVGMPLVCFVFDPLVFKTTFPPDNPGAIDVFFEPAGTIQGARVNQYGHFVYPFAGWQMVMLTLWLAIGPRIVRWSGLFSGTFVMGAGVAWLIGLVLIIPSLLGTILFGIGLLGLTPLLTAFVYSRQFLRANSAQGDVGIASVPAVHALIGIIAAVAVPTMIGLTLQAVLRGTIVFATLRGA